MDECKPLPPAAMKSLGIITSSLPSARGLHSFPLPLNLSLLCPFLLNLI